MLTLQQQAFVREYLVDLCSTQAAIRAGYSARTASSQGNRLLKVPAISAAVETEIAARTERTHIRQDAVLRRLWAIATADANDLIQYRRLCCRHCHGFTHEFQWVDEAELQRACNAFKVAAASGEVIGDPPTAAGGFGFDPHRRPHPDCRRCFGEGHGEVFVADTRDLSDQARLLYRGMKVTRGGGLEVLMEDPMAAMHAVAKHLGMNRVTLAGDQSNPIRMLLDRMGKSALNVVADIEDEETVA